MSDRNETKQGKLDIISSLQMKQSQPVDKKKVEEKEECWSDYSDDDDYPTNKLSEASTVVKVEDKSKKYSNLKEVFNESNANKHAHHHKGGHYGNKNKKRQGGTFYKEREQRNPNELARPVFVNTNKSAGVNSGVNSGAPVNTMNDPYNFKNTNQEYTKKNYYNNNYSHTERGGERERRYHNQGHNNHHNNYNNNYNNNYHGHGQRGYNNTTKPQDEKESVMKSISNFSNIVKNVNEDNKGIKAPLKNYTDVDLTKDKYKTKPDELQRPTFINTSLENKPNNFKELNHEGDLFLKKIQEGHADEMVEYSQKKEYKKRGHGNEHGHEPEHSNRENENQEVLEKNDNAVSREDESENTHDSFSHSHNKFDYDGYKKKKRYGGGYHNKFHNDDLWNIVTNSTQEEGDNGVYNEHNTEYKPKPKKIIRKGNPDETKKPEVHSNQPVTDKVVVSVSNVKSIKEIFG